MEHVQPVVHKAYDHYTDHHASYRSDASVKADASKYGRRNCVA